ncbi:MAG: alpha/beta hydrolase [Acidiferrobacterales bacterium]|nr:alpha/beta hydrolase [Acidiferrobacterales bacterium]
MKPIVYKSLANSSATRLFALLISILCLNACSNTGLALINIRANLLSNHTLVSDIRYGDEAWQTLDLYIPDNPKKSKQTNTNLVFFYGGGWVDGSKEQYLFVASKFANLGYWVIVPDYVKYPQGKFPTFVQDGALAIAWLTKHIKEYGGNSENIVVAGHSAGAHLGALLISDQTYLNNLGLSPNDIRAFAGLAGPYNFTPTEPRYVRIFEPPSNFPKMQVINSIDGDEPPMLLLHGGDDTVVSVENMESTLARIEMVGGIGKGVVYQGVSHVRILLGVTSPWIGNSDPTNDIDEFFRLHTK